jgi:hypothetical protein
MHPERAYRVVEISGQLELLCDMLTGRRFPRCTAFRYGKLHLLNDSPTLEGVQTYAAVRDDRQIDSFLVSELTRDTLVNRVFLLEAFGSENVDLGNVTLKEHGPEECELCRT